MLFLLVVLGLILYFALRKKSDPPLTPPAGPGFDTEAYDEQWVTFIRSYYSVAKTKTERAMIDRMIADLTAQGYRSPTTTSTDQSYAPTVGLTAQQVTATSVSPPLAAAPEKSKAQTQLDNASLLLYFGAFLLVASAGLFVAFGGLNGTLRTLVVLLVTLALYGGGLAIFENRPRFKQAGLAFVGIGMAIAPLIGLAAFTYVFNKQEAAGVWLFTSIYCLALYGHALYKLRNPLLNYVLIFTFLSMFESTVAIIHLPVYYFGWGLAIIGLALSLLARRKGVWTDMQESSANSAMIFMPVAILMSLVLVGQQGSMQLGISLLLAAAFYGLQVLDTSDETQRLNAVASQVLVLGGITALCYSITKDWHITGEALAVVNIVQLMFVLARPALDLKMRNFASVTLFYSITAILIVAGSKPLILAMVVLATVIAAFISFKQKRNDVYALAAVGLTTIPVIYAQYVSSPTLSATTTVLYLGLAGLIQFGVLIGGRKALDFIMDGTAQYLYLATVIAVLAGSYLATPWLTFWLSLTVGASFIVLGALHTSVEDWNSTAGLAVCAPLLWWFHSPGVFLAAAITALIFNILIALRYRRELNRWLSAGLWLLLPVASGQMSHWSQPTYAYAYLVAMFGLIFSRAIARGIVFISSKIPLASYAKNTSVSYVYGYCLAAAISVGISLGTEASRLHTTLILVVLLFTSLLLTYVVEKQSDLMALLPLLAQGVLVSGLRPSSDIEIQMYLLASVAVASVSYFAIKDSIEVQPEQVSVRSASLATLAIAPLSFIFVGHTLLAMPIGLLVATIILGYHFRHGLQSTKELVWGGVALTIVWVLNYAAVTQVQAYVHVFIALFAAYAYWRHVRGEIEESDKYLLAMLLTATIPLAVQAVSATAGGVYGWWLLLEQIGFIIIGMSINKKFVTKWGLYVAVASVIYQLRSLGWAALTVLAIFLIGLAIYKIQKNVDKK